MQFLCFPQLVCKGQCDMRTNLLPLFLYCLELLIALFQLGVKFVGRAAPSETTNNISNTYKCSLPFSAFHSSSPDRTSINSYSAGKLHLFINTSRQRNQGCPIHLVQANCNETIVKILTTIYQY